MKRTLPIVATTATVSALLVLLLPALADEPAVPGALDGFTRDWREDKAWYDGKAEIAEYEATRVIYGKERQYTAKIMVNKEKADPQTKTKSATNKGREVFKLHTREDVPTEKYTYHYSTMVYVGTDDLKSLKIDMGSQEDCGATFKQFINHAGEVNWHQFSYFPNQGHRSGEYEPPTNFVFSDALPVVLRGYPFDNPPETMKLMLLPDQTTTKWSLPEPEEVVVEYLGRQEIELPFGKVQAHHIGVGPWRAGGLEPREQFWFSADPEHRHVMVAYRDASGTKYELKSLRREAYWVN